MTQDPSRPVRLPVFRLAAVLTGAAALGAIIASALATTRSGGPDGWMTLLATMPGILASCLLLASRDARPAGAWAAPVLVGTMARALVTLVIAGGMSAALPLDKPLFMLTVLGVLLVCLAIEVGVVLRTVNTRDAGLRPSSLEGARS